MTETRVLTWLAGLIEQAYVVIGFLLFSGAFIAIPVKLTEGSLVPGQVNPWSTLSTAALLAGGIVIAYVHRRSVGALLLRGGVVNAFVVLALMSALWSFAPDITLRRWVTLATSVLFAYVAVERFELARLVRMMALACLIAALGSIVVAFALPRAGIATPSHPGAWNGVFGHKNSLGWMMILMAICYICIWVDEPARRWSAAIALAICLGVTSMTQSMTSFVSIGIAALLRLLLTVGRAAPLPRLWLLSLVGATVVGGSLIMVTFWTEIMTALHRDPTLTGRVPLWAEVLLRIADAPVLGWGYGGYWLEWNPDMRLLWQAVGWEPPDAHSGYLDLAVQLGVGGALLGIAPLVLGIRRSVRAYLAGTLPGAPFAFVFLVILFIGSLDESSLYRGDIHCVLMVICYLSLQKWRGVAKQAPAPQPRWRPRHATPFEENGSA